MFDLFFTPWGMIAVASLLVLLLAIPGSLYLRRAANARRIQSMLEKHTSGMIKDAVIPDGIDGYVFADYLLRIGNSIVTLNIESRKGYVFGAPNIDEWTCVENKRSEKFNNPLKRATLFAQQAKHLSGFHHVDALVLFDNNSEFPKGVPQGVLRLARFEEEIDVLNGRDNEHKAAEQAWATLIAITDEARTQLDAHDN